MQVDPTDLATGLVCVLAAIGAAFSLPRLRRGLRRWRRSVKWRARMYFSMRPDERDEDDEDGR